MTISYKDYSINFIDKCTKNIIVCLNFYQEEFNLETDVSLLTISKEDIEDYFTPYPRLNFKGYADLLLPDLEEIIKILKNTLDLKDVSFYIEGYSLAGLCAIYVCYKSDLFKGFISCSGSLWYPDFMDYIKNNNISKNVTKCYLSIGDKEARGGNGMFKNAILNTNEASNYFKSLKIKSKFELNKGTHFDDVLSRILKGISYIGSGGNINEI